MVNAWSDDDNLTILNVGILLLFGGWVVWVRCKIHGVINLLFLNLYKVTVSYRYLYWQYY